MSHGTAIVMNVEDPTEGLSEGVGNIDDARNMSENNVATLFPFLNSKKLDINVSGAISWFARIDHFDCRRVVFVQNGVRVIFVLVAQFRKDGSEIFDQLGGSDGGNKFGFGAESDRRFFGSVTYAAST
jgi:hypothetical protein